MFEILSDMFDKMFNPIVSASSSDKSSWMILQLSKSIKNIESKVKGWMDLFLLNYPIAKQTNKHKNKDN